MENINQSPIFIGGLMKSGTSLLRKLVSLHPNIFGGLETHWFSQDFITHWQDGNSTRQKWLLEFFDVKEEEIQHLRSSANSSYEFFDAFMNYCTQRSGKNRWVEKTPDNVFHVDTILEHWIDAKILVMQRDYKDVYASWKKNKKRTFEIYLDTAKEYGNVVTKWSEEKEVFRIVTYKDLVSQPRETLQNILAFIGEEYIEGLENYNGDDTDYNKVLTVTGKVSPTTASLKKPIFTTGLGQWEQMLSKDEVEKINQYLG